MGVNATLDIRQRGVLTNILSTPSNTNNQDKQPTGSSVRLISVRILSLEVRNYFRFERWPFVIDQKLSD